MLSLEILAAIEDIVRTKLGKDAVLGDYFDYIAGTSTGAIIAAGLSRGMPVSEIRTVYHKHGEEMFDKAFILDRYRFKFDSDRLQRLMQRTFGERTTFGDEELKTLLMVVLRNATTDSPWPLSNNPNAKYNDPTRSDCNLNFPLWQLVRASTAAPTYFPPEVIMFGEDPRVFVDGGVTMYNNPAFQLFLMATVEPYNLCWETGRDKMLVVSLGTGTSPDANKDLQPGQMNLLYNASSIPSALMYAALNEQDFLCRVFGDTLAGDELDREIGTMIGKKGPTAEKLFTYVRYNAELTRSGLDALGLPAIQPENVQKLDSIEGIPELQQVGRAVGRLKVKPEHFDRFV